MGYRIIFWVFLMIGVGSVYAQQRLPEGFYTNDVSDIRPEQTAIINARVYISATEVLENAIILIDRGRVVEVAEQLDIPPSAQVVDLEGFVIYPGFVEAQAPGLGLTTRSVPERNWQQAPKLHPLRAGLYGSNDAIRAEYNAFEELNLRAADAATALAQLRSIGVGAAVSFQPDGIARGSGVAVLLSDLSTQERVLRSQAAAYYALDKGSSVQENPNSLMGSVALLRQTYYDAAWYNGQSGDRSQVNRSLAAITDQADLPKVFSVQTNRQAVLAQRIAEEFSLEYILHGSGTAYQNVADFQATGARFLLPLTFPEAPQVSDPLALLEVGYTTLRHWEAAASNAAILNQADVPFTFTTQGITSSEALFRALRLVTERGLPESEALAALTSRPAAWLGLSDEVGSLRAGSWANFVVLSTSLFDPEAVLYENWVQGRRFVYRDADRTSFAGNYAFSVQDSTFTLEIREVQNAAAAYFIAEGDTTQRQAVVQQSPGRITFRFEGFGGQTFLTGWHEGTSIRGTAFLPNGETATFLAAYSGAVEADEEEEESTETASDSVVVRPLYPFSAYGADTIPQTRTYLIRNATVWTGEEIGVLEGTDVLLSEGNITAIGRGLALPEGGIVVDGTGKYLTAGIVDEHAHLALYSINEWSEAVSADVRMSDAVQANDVNLYRQLAGGVTSAQLLHGSANPIGGQSALIKFRWGRPAEELLIEDAPQFIKFALGENVKQSNTPFAWNRRFPQTRMGVEQVIEDAFVRARAYQADRRNRNRRTDLELETIAQILEGDRYITCHSYVQSEVNMLINLTTRYGTRVNTFTHILEGYKMADKLRQHGAGGSTFSDWWAYKFEVRDAIPYNAALMNAAGVLTAVNSDDDEMGRRLNQEAAKAVKWGGSSQQDAWRMVTLNPARMLHLDDRLGSIRVGKDADVVLWNEEPLSIYARAEKTFIDGALYYDRAQDVQRARAIQQDTYRLVQRILSTQDESN